MAGDRDDWRGWDLDGDDDHHHADGGQKRVDGTRNAKQQARGALPNYNVDAAENLVLDEESGIVITQTDIDAALRELGLEADMIAAELDPREAQRSRELSTPAQERPRRAFLRRGLLERRNKMNADASQAKRRYLDQQVLQKGEKHIVYSRRTLANLKRRRPFHSDCAHGKGSALPIGFADRALIEALQDRARDGDSHARKALRRIFGRLDDDDDSSIEIDGSVDSTTDADDAAHDESTFEDLEIELPSPRLASRPNGPRSPPRLVHSPSRLPASISRADALTYRDDTGTKAMAITCTPRSLYDSDDSSPDNDDPYARRGRRRKRKRTPAKGVRTDDSDAARAPSAHHQKIRRVTLEEALSWFEDYELNADDRYLSASEQAGWRAWQRAEEEREHAEWLAAPETVPDPDSTTPSLLRLEVRLASSFAPCWLLPGTADPDPELFFQAPLPTERAIDWPSGLLKWWLSAENDVRRRKFLDAEARSACAAEFVLSQAEKFRVHEVVPEDASAHDRPSRQRWRDFRSWYFSEDGTLGRQQFLTAKVNQLARAWDTEWAKWVRFALDREILRDETRALLGPNPVRWGLVQAFMPDLGPVTDELAFRETWGEALHWNKMTEEERWTEAQVALCDQIVCSVAEAEGVKKKATGEDNANKVDNSGEAVSDDDDDDVSDDDDDDDVGEDDEDEDAMSEDEMEVFLMWFAGNSHVRGNFLRREIQCAAGDFVMDRAVFRGALSEDVPEKDMITLRRKMSMSASALAEKRLKPHRDSILSEASALQELRDALSASGKFSEVDDGDTSFPSGLDDESPGEDTFDKKRTKPAAEGRLVQRRQDLEAAKNDLELARRLFDEICQKCDSSEAAKLNRVGREYETASNQARRKSVRRARRASRTLNANARLAKLDLVQEQCDVELDALRLRRRASEVAERHSIEVIRNLCKVHLETIELSHQAAQERLLEALRTTDDSDDDDDVDVSETSFGRRGLTRGRETQFEVQERQDAAKQLADILQRLNALAEEETSSRPQRKRSIFDNFQKVSRACLGSQRASRMLRKGVPPLLRQGSSLEEDLSRELQAPSGASFQGADPLLDPNMNTFKSWYSTNKKVRMTYLQNRMTKLGNFRSAMRERGQGRRLIGRGIFTPEEDLEVPPVDAAVLRRLKLKKLYGLFRIEELEDDDESMRRGEAQGQADLELELQRMRDAEIRGLRKNLMREIAKEVLEVYHRKHFDVDEVSSAVLSAIRFTGQVRPQAVGLADQAKYPHGSGLDNGDEEYDRDLERFEAERTMREKEEQVRKAELQLMRAEDEALKKFYTRERRALLMVEAEAELNARALRERDEDRQRREHPSGLCWRELRDLDRREMEQEDFDSRQRWQEIEAYEAAEALRIQQEAQHQLDLQLAEEEELWRNLEERRRIAQQDALVCCRELHEMAEEDLRSSYNNRVWEEERHRLARLRWMESVAFAKFDPFFKTRAESPPAEFDTEERAEDEESARNGVKTDGARLHAERDRHETFRVAHRIKFLAPLSNKYQQVIGIPASCRTSDTYTRKFRSLRKLKKKTHKDSSEELGSVETGTDDEDNRRRDGAHAAERARARAAKRAARAAMELQRQRALEAAGTPLRPLIAIKGCRADY